MGLALRELIKGNARGIVHLYPEYSLVRPPIKFSVEQREGNVVYGKVLPIGGKGHMEAVVKKMRGVEEPPLVPFLMPGGCLCAGPGPAAGTRRGRPLPRP